MPRNGPSGTYSQPWMSRADQSLSPTTPKTWSAKAEVGTGEPSAIGTPTTKPSSASMSSRSRRAERSAPSSAGALRWPRGPAHVGAGDHDRPGPAVVADRQVPPVRQQRLGVGPEDPPDVGGVVERGVEVDVVGHLERQPQRAPRRAARRWGPTTASDGRGRAARPAARPARRRPDLGTGGQERVQRRLRRTARRARRTPRPHGGARSSTWSPIRTPTRARSVAGGEDAVRQVVDVEAGAGGARRPRSCAHAAGTRTIVTQRARRPARAPARASSSSPWARQFSASPSIDREDVAAHHRRPAR